MSRGRCVVRVVIVAVVLGAVACGKSSSSGGGTGTGTGSGTGTGTARGAVAIFVDDQQVSSVDAAALASWPRLDELLPPQAQRMGTWTQLTIKGAAPQDIAKPADTHPNLVPALYPGPDGGAAALGLFDVVDLVKKAPPKVTIGGVTELRIKLDPDSDRGMNEEGHGKMVDPTQLVVTIEGGSVPQLTGAQILALPRETPPNGDTLNQGWKLTALLDAAGVKAPKALLLTDPNGGTLNLAAADLDPKQSVPFLKLNRQGALRLRVYKKQGDGWTIGGNLRGIASIKVTK